MLTCHRLLLITPVLAATLSGCGGWSAWVQRNHHEPVEMTHREATDELYRSQPHSAPSEVFNENYDPYHGQLEPYGTQSRRFAPPPVPPAQNNETTSNLNRQNSQADPASADEQLIRTLKKPRIFSPESVRNIYDRIRGTPSEQPPSERIKRDGPIALRQNLPSPTQPCGYDELISAGPVRLGIPETEEGPLLHPVLPQLDGPAGSRLPAVVQAGPSSYSRPMYADPLSLSDSRR